MQAVTQTFKDTWAAMPTRDASFSVTLKRRYWNGAAYVLEASPLTIPASAIEKISPINWKFDTATQNKILASNVTIRLRNEDWKYLESNGTDGVFKADGVATSGYDPYKSEYQIFYGYTLPDGTTESVALFTGEGEQYRFNTKDNTVEILIKGRELKLSTADAQKVTTTFTNVSTDPAAGDGLNQEFETDLSVWAIDSVRKATVAAVQGDPDIGETGYKISNVSDLENKLKLTLTPAPPSPDAIDWSGRQWLRNKTVGTLVAAVCDEAGIGAGERDISEPVFPSVSQFLLNPDTQAHWDAAIKVDTDSAFFPGSLTIGNRIANGDFEAGDLTDWTTAGIGGGNPAAIGPGAGSHDGNWYCTVGTIGGSTIAGESVVAEVRLDTVAPTPGGFGTGGVVRKSLGDNADFTADSIVLPPGQSTPVFLSFVMYKVQDQNQFYRVTSVQSTKYAQTITFKYVMRQFGFTFPEFFNRTFNVDTIKFLETTATGTFESDAIDLLAVPQGFGKLLETTTLNGGTVTYQTATAPASGGPYTSFVNLDGSDNIVSPLDQFIKVRADLTSNVAVDNGPIIDSVKINFFGSELFVGHADFKGKDCQSAIQRLAEISNMEWGFTGAGRFFFRSKAVGSTPVLTLDQSNAIEALDNYNAGYDRVRNAITVTYGNYYNEKDSVTQGEASPTSIERFGRIVLALTVNDFLFANSANFANNIAQLLYEDNYRPRRRFRALTRIIPHLELSDVVEVSFFDSPLIENNIFGDPFQVGFPSLADSENTIARGIICKVVGIATNVITGTSSIDFQEVLT